jgi:hypothetical protein
MAVTGTATGDNSKVDADGSPHSLLLTTRGLLCASIWVNAFGARAARSAA